VSVPLYQRKAELFGTLGHPCRIRVLELLRGGPHSARDMIANIDIPASSLSHQLAVLRHAGVIVKHPDGRYALAGPDLADLMGAARRFLTPPLAIQNGLPAASSTGADTDEVMATSALTSPRPTYRPGPAVPWDDPRSRTGPILGHRRDRDAHRRPTDGI